MPEEMVPLIAQYGIAGLMGALWLMERRHSATRERELSESHTLLVRQREELSEMMDVVKENSRAMSAVERSQARLTQVCEEIAGHLRSRRSGRPPSGDSAAKM